MTENAEICTNHDTGSVSIEVLNQLQFEWLARLSRMSDLTSLVIDSNLDVVYYENVLLDMLEFDHPGFHNF